MSKTAKIILIIFSVILLIVASGLYFLNSFLRALAPADITITENYISTNRDFINGVTIAKIKVDSMGADNYPIKYTVTYWTSCSIDHPTDRPPDPPDKIYFNKEGKYKWTEEIVSIPFTYPGISADTIQRIMWSAGTNIFKTCPLKFQKEQWYYFTLGDPKITGIFFFIDKNGKPNQKTIQSGVSPI